MLAAVVRRRLSSAAPRASASSAAPSAGARKQLADDEDSREAITWSLLKRAMDEKQEVYARVLRRTRAGYLLDILGRVAFLPLPLAGGRPVAAKSSIRPRGDAE
ncbi:hypothetical protein KFE25_009656 [Diacronema lutheri]|uniref:Uncharacterized protein n=1 Tax=Diacronema lutheri TaxID=2081491 RepID=A0A8J5Y3Z9_DIALT|nr:hypothetical protein KFE25_009656 [Diacronema lutheri]